MSFHKKLTDDLRRNLLKFKTEDGREVYQMINDLLKAEDEFKKLLVSSGRSKEVYEKFMDFILDKKIGKGNMLSARAYFRERQTTFTKEMFPIFKVKKPAKLVKFKVNYKFCKFVIDMLPANENQEIYKKFNEITYLRNMIIENTIPLGINRAHLFYKYNKNSKISFDDVEQSAQEGIIIAVDKFVPKDGKTKSNRDFNGVSIGRMALEMRDSGSQTDVKFTPFENRLLYRIRLFKKSHIDYTDDDLHQFVIESKVFRKVTKSQIQNLINAAENVISLDYNEDGANPISDRIGDSKLNPEEELDKSESEVLIHIGMKSVSILERKVLSLKFGIPTGDSDE